MMVQYTISKISSIRTRANGDVGTATFEIAGENGDFTLSIQTRVGGPVFRVSGDTLTAHDDHAVAMVEAARAKNDARIQSLRATDVAADASFGPITVGTPKQLIYAQTCRASWCLVEHGGSRYDETVSALNLDADVRAAWSKLHAHAVFWIEFGKMSENFKRWMVATDRADTVIGRLLAEVE